MSNTSDRLFVLIKTLKANEKRYFKRFTNIQETQDGKTKAYIILFDVLDKMEKFDEQGAKTAMKNYLTNKPAQWSNLKTYLYHAILRALRFFHEQNSLESKLYAQFQEAAILEKRGLYEQCNKILEQLKKQVIIYEKHGLLIEILRKQVMLAFDAKAKGLEGTINQYYGDIHEGLDKLNTEVKVEQLTHQLFSQIRHQGGVRESEKEVKAKIDAITDNPLYKDISKAITFRSRYLFYYTKVIYHQLMKDSKAAFKNMELLIKEWDKNPKMIKGYPKQYKIYLTNYLSFCVALRKIKEVPIYLKTMKAIESKSFDEEGETLQNIYYIELLFHIITYQPKEAVKVIPKIERLLETHKSKVNKSREITFYYHITILYFMMEDYRNALSWAYKIIFDGDRSDLRKDMQLFVRIVQLIFHYELKNNKVFEHMQTTYRTLHRTGKLYRFEKIVLQHIRKLINAVDKTEKMDTFKKFKTEMDLLSQDIPSSSRVGMGDVLAWLDSKLQNRPIIEILREQNPPPKDSQ